MENMINELMEQFRNKKLNPEDREKAIALVNAYFDGKTILMKDPEAGVPDWISIKHPEYWSYLEQFCKNVDKYRILEDRVVSPLPDKELKE